MSIEFTNNEKQFLTMLFKIGKEFLDSCNGYIDIDYVTFNNNDLFYLAEKLGIDY